MEQELLLKFKKALEKSSAELKEKIEELEKPKDFGDDIDSLEAESDETEEMGNRISVAGEYRQKLANIDIALQKINEGKYGICEKCGNEIEREILDLVPESDLCKECKMEGR
jgi:DnaK suppressor protein